MMKKVLYGVALALFASVSVGSLQSCKDDVNDLRTQTSYDLNALQGKIKAEMDALEARVAANEGAIAQIKRDYATLAYVDGEIARVEAGYAAADAALEQRINGALSTLTQRIDGLDVEVAKKADKDYVDGELGALKDQLAALEEVAATKAEVEEVWQQIEAVQQQMTQMMNYLENMIDEEVEKLQTQIDSMLDALDNITRRLDKQVTGLLIQGVYSPVFGDFSLPIGVKSNILFNWYGKNSHNKDIKFPSNDFNVNGEPGLDFAKVAPEKYFTAAQGYYGNEDEGQMSLGTVYVTVNPVGAMLDNLSNVTLETSAGTVLPWKVNLEPSDKELTFGLGTRSEANGFYEGKVVASVEEVMDNVNVEIEEGLKASMKNALKDPSMTTAKELIKAVYDQLSGKLPAYGLRYSWSTAPEDEVDGGFTPNSSVSVLSQYDLAVAASKPLSYNFLADYPGSSKKLPIVGHIENLIDRIKNSGALSFKLDPITVGEITIDFSTLTVDVAGEGTELKIVIPDVVMEKAGQQVKTTLYLTTQDKDDVKGVDWTKNEYIQITGLGDMQKAIADGIKDALEEAGGTISTEIQNQLQTQINSIITKINDEIGAKVNSLLNSASNKLEPYFGKINKAFDIYNKVANKVNNFLSDPNAYLQVAAFYKINNGYGIASGKASDPTPVVGDGDFTIYLSSYTAELIVPACKKYVAITSAPAGVDVKSVNTGDLNKVLDGDQVEVNVAGLSKAGVYEFTYQALDYNGYTSTKKFYIEVK